jgi:hypothetical protein
MELSQVEELKQRIAQVNMYDEIDTWLTAGTAGCTPYG